MSWIPSLINGPLLAFGAAAMSVPIIIHLLNKRKFKTVDWAAMDFLLEADKKNRRRVQLENLILLALRCLACLLIGLMLARPIIEQTKLLFFDTEKFDRVVLLDDSLSMDVAEADKSGFEKAKSALAEFVRGLTENETADAITLHLMSNPQAPIINAENVNDESLAEIIRKIDELEPSSHTKELSEALADVNKLINSKKDNEAQQVLYIVSDMRERDWALTEASEDAAAEGVAGTLRDMASGDEGTSVYLVDVGEQDDLNNLIITRVSTQQKALVAGVKADFNVAVRNTGNTDAKGVTLRFKQGDAAPFDVGLPDIAAGATEEGSVQFTFPRLADPRNPKVQPLKLVASIVPSEESSGSDAMLHDNEFYFAARVQPGVKTLIVDGDRQHIGEKSESFFLRKALGAQGGGVSVKVIGDEIFNLEVDDEESQIFLRDYRVIYLCNIYNISEDRLVELEKWVDNGGGLVISVGNHVDADIYNDKLYKDGNGLLPVQLDTMEGFEEQDDWVQFNPQTANHPVLFLQESSRILVDAIKVFQWFTSDVDEAALEAGEINILSRFTDEAQSPAMVEKRYGDGRVFLITTSVDRDWTDWPIDMFSYVATAHDLNRYLDRRTADDANLATGRPIHQTIDLTEFQQDATLVLPDAEEEDLQAVPSTEAVEEENGEGDENEANVEQVLYDIAYPDVNQRGFYSLKLSPRDGGEPTEVLFAANMNPSEGELARADTKELLRRLGDAKVELVSNTSLVRLTGDRSKGEWTIWVLIGLIVVLCIEQFLAWSFGQKR